MHNFFFSFPFRFWEACESSPRLPIEEEGGNENDCQIKTASQQGSSCIPLWRPKLQNTDYYLCNLMLNLWLHFVFLHLEVLPSANSLMPVITFYLHLLHSTSVTESRCTGAASVLKQWCDLFSLVAEVLEEGDCTVPLAVIGSVCALLLLVLLCICIVLCYRQRKQTSRHQNCLWTHICLPHNLPTQKLWLKSNEEDGRLHGVTRHCPVVAFNKGAEYSFRQKQNISCQRECFTCQETAAEKVREVCGFLQDWWFRNSWKKVNNREWLLKQRMQNGTLGRLCTYVTEYFSQIGVPYDHIYFSEDYRL